MLVPAKLPAKIALSDKPAPICAYIPLTRQLLANTSSVNFRILFAWGKTMKKSISFVQKKKHWSLLRPE
jgi:hypothetical protein